jgi:bacitracin synthase 3
LKINYEQQLNKVIAHCVNREEREFTPSDFTYKNLSIPEIDSLTKKHEIEDIYTLSSMQEGILFHVLKDRASLTYLEQTSFRLHGKLDPAVVERTLNALFARHDILRTAFVFDNYDKPLQIVLRERKVDFLYEDIREKSAVEKTAVIEDYKNRNKINKFNLEKDVLMRVALFQLSAEEFELTWTFHHILMDGWCISIIISEFFAIYDSFLKGKDYVLPPVKPYKNYIKWLNSRDREESETFWRDYLSGYDSAASVPVPVLQEKSESSVYRNEEIIISLDKQKTTELNKLAIDSKVTLNTVIQAVWGIILGKYCSKDDVVFGTIVSGRSSLVEGVETMVGLFMNAVPVRIKLAKDKRFDNLLTTVQQDYIESEPHHYVSLAEIQATSILKHELLSHLVVFENYPVMEIDSMAGADEGGRKIDLELANIDFFEQSIYDFNIAVGGYEKLIVKLSYNSEVFDAKSIKRIGSHIIEVIDEVIADSTITLKDIKISHGLMSATSSIQQEDQGDFIF